MAREISFTRTIHPIDMAEIKFKFYNSGMVTVSNKDGEHEIAMYKKCPFISSRRERNGKFIVQPLLLRKEEIVNFL